jgi:hypothetical protein
MTKSEAREIDSLDIKDIEHSPVWEYVRGETLVRPARVPVSSLRNRVVAVRVRLRNEDSVWALIGNIDLDQPKFTRHFMTISLWNAGRWFHLARYHDFDYSTRGPEALANFLGLGIDDVFPIEYDVRKYVKGFSEALSGQIPKEPAEKLDRSEIIAMAVP